MNRSVYFPNVIGGASDQHFLFLPAQYLLRRALQKRSKVNSSGQGEKLRCYRSSNSSSPPLWELWSGHGWPELSMVGGNRPVPSFISPWVWDTREGPWSWSRQLSSAETIATGDGSWKLSVHRTPRSGDMDFFLPSCPSPCIPAFNYDQQWSDCNIIYVSFEYLDQVWSPVFFIQLRSCFSNTFPWTWSIKINAYRRSTWINDTQVWCLGLWGLFLKLEHKVSKSNI